MVDVTDHLVGEARKNVGEEVRVFRKQYQGHDLVDARVYVVRLTQNGEDQPTRKGLCCSLETWRELLPLIEQALEDT